MSLDIADTDALTARLEAMVAAAPEAEDSISSDDAAPRNIRQATGVPARYRQEWPRPKDGEWPVNFRKIMARVDNGGIVALIGPRGTGKTRLACEAIRNYAPESASYVTAMGLFLRIRSTFGKKAGESESDIERELTSARLLVLDEVQERGGSAWEDRLLTHIIDVRYGAMKPTIILANLLEDAIAAQLGDSIVSRMQETGGVLAITGPSHRLNPTT
jgi:DNA replication protein DnaC